jgi:hypothetical protein
MTAKHKNLFLYLALACFVGIILIFIFDGYIGVYDRLVIDNGQYLQTVENDQWGRTDRFSGISTVTMERGARVDFTYTIENHRFSEYSNSVDISLWHNKEKVADLLSRQLAVPAFDKEEMTWSINTVNIIPADYPTEQSYNVNIIIKRGDTEREVTIYVSPQIIIKPVPQ